MNSVKILNINRRATNEIDVALPFDSDAQVLAVWDYIMANRRADSFRCDPEVEGEDPDRAWMGQYLANYRAGTPQSVRWRRSGPPCHPENLGCRDEYDIRELLGI